MLEARDVFAFLGLILLSAGAGAVGYELGGAGIAAGGALGVPGAGLFYLGVFHGRRG